MKALWKSIPQPMKWIGLSIFIMSLFGGVGFAEGTAEPPPDVAIVAHVSGEITYTSGQRNPSKVQAFMKLRQGDLLKLPAESQIKLLFLKDGKQQIWQGEVELKVEDSGCQPIGETLSQRQLQDKLLLPQITRAIKDTPLPLLRRGAGVTLRKIKLTEEDRADIKAAEDLYNDLKTYYTDDITLELYLLSVYAKYEQYDEGIRKKFQEKIQALLDVYPNNPLLQRWDAWIKLRFKK